MCAIQQSLCQVPGAAFPVHFRLANHDARAPIGFVAQHDPKSAAQLAAKVAGSAGRDPVQLRTRRRS
jgi:hypothetical protein